MKKNHNKAKSDNLKALPLFLVVLVVSFVVGGLVGYLSAEFRLDTLSGAMQSAANFFTFRAAPWLMILLAILVPAVSIPKYRKAKWLFASWDGEDEAVSDEADAIISVVIWITSAALILSYFLIAATYSCGMSSFAESETVVPFFAGLVGFLVIMAEALVIQQKCVDLTKKMSPEKDGVSVYDMKFQKKWMDKCDEAEKAMIGKCAFKAYGATNTVCCVLAVVLAISALVFGIGFLPSAVVCLVWLVNLSVYCAESTKCSKSGSKKS